jgi:hypothetical protein
MPRANNSTLAANWAYSSFCGLAGATVGQITATTGLLL